MAVPHVLYRHCIVIMLVETCTTFKWLPLTFFSIRNLKNKEPHSLMNDREPHTFIFQVVTILLVGSHLRAPHVLHQCV